MNATAAEWANTSKRPYRPRGAALELLRCRRPELLISGPAGTGKSRACLEKLHLCAEKYAGMRGLIVRKTRESLSESALFTFETKVVPHGHPALVPMKRNSRQHYHYPNGSEVVVGGLDKPSKIMSTEFDFVFIQEAVELEEGEWEDVTSRLRNGVMPYQQLIADTNPDKPTHWLKQRCDNGQTLLLESRHEDNPTVTPAYIAVLDALTGPRKGRLRYGRWTQAEGIVYDGWDAAIHLINRFPIPKDWQRYWAVDFGYTNPFVCQFWAKDHDGRLYLYREVYHTGRLVQDHAARLLELCGATKGWQGAREPMPHAVVCDHDAEGRATLERHLGLRTTPADKAISPGIQAVAARLRPAGDGKPRLFVLRDCLDERDPELAAAKKPCSTAEEFEGFVWDTRAGRRKGEAPVDRDNHGMDCARYLVAYLDGRPQPGGIEPPRRDNRLESARVPRGV